MRIPLLLPLAALLMSTQGSAQRSHGGEPHRWGQPHGDPFTHLPEARPHPPVTAAQTVDPSTASFRYGVQCAVRADVVAEGEWLETAWEGRICRLRLTSPGAAMLSVQFDRWELPEGAMVYLYDEARTRFIGGFDRSNRAPDGTMATAVLPGDAVVVEYRVPEGAEPGELRVAGITHGTIGLFGTATGEERDFNPGFQSAPCHINVACPEAAAWQKEKRAVVMFLRPDGGGCTGTLINNTAQPGRPLFYAASHCYQPTTSQWVFYFNYEAPACVGDTGSTAHTLTGATFLSGDYYADFILLELSGPPPAHYQPYYAGWDRSGDTPQTGTVIHHPLYDVKKITLDHDPATDYFDPDGIPMWRNFWDLGLVEAVSSGAVLWDQNRRIVGHMSDGAQDCTNAATAHTGCAKFTAGWDGPIPESRKRDWLDPSNTVVRLDGYDPNAAPSVAVRPRAFLEGPLNAGTGLMNATLGASGLLPLTEPYTANGYGHTGGGGETTTLPVLNAAGNDAVVDWVVVELRDKDDPAQLIATRSALLQRDGDIVGTDGSPDVVFNSVAAGQYHVAVRHRNHLGIMTASPQALSATASTLDLGGGAVPLFGGASAARSLGGRMVMYAGDVNGDGVLRYTGQSNDRDPVLVRIGGTVPTATVGGYFTEDVNLDGAVRYTGSANDRDPILVNIGGSVPTAVRTASLP